ncbi:transposable element Tcb1 transposase [Trichonephila clavipes]|nr:transposable element Tcb1 transposase [Trichonephila clavipes]
MATRVGLPFEVTSRRKQRSVFGQVFEFDRGRIVAYRDCGLSFREIGSPVGRNQRTEMQICDRWMQEDTTDQRGRSQPPHCLRVPFDSVYSRVVCPQDIHCLVDSIAEPQTSPPPMLQ